MRAGELKNGKTVVKDEVTEEIVKGGVTWWWTGGCAICDCSTV